MKRDDANRETSATSIAANVVRQIFVGVVLLTMCVMVGAKAVHAQNQTVILRVVVRDSTSRDSLTGGTVELRSPKLSRSATLGANGVATFTSLVPGAYSVSVIRMGYRPRVSPVLIDNADTTLVLRLEQLPTELARFQVRAAAQEIFGSIGALPGPNAVPNANVRLSAGSSGLLDAPLTFVTDTTGKYIFRNLKPGQYVLRIVASGYADRMRLINLPEATAFESSHLLERGKGNSNQMKVAMRDMELRVRSRTFTSALVPADELYRHSGGVIGMVKYAQEVAAKGIDPAGACVVLDGRLMRNWTLDNMRSDGIQFVEVYDTPHTSRRYTKSASDATRCGPATVCMWTTR